ncbi:MAG: CoA ester lyase [Steroidobacteraceae bacterium]
MTSARRMPSGIRSYLFAPGNHPRRAAKVFAAGADAAILDLEDAVPPAEKEATRGLVVAALREPRSVRGYVRVNAADTRWCLEDVDAVVGPWLDGLVLPKAESPAQLQALDARIADAERRAGMAPGSIDLMAIIETALGVETAGPIAAAVPRLARLAFGGGDYTHDLDLVWTEGEAELAYARARIAHASRIAGLEPPVDTVVLQVRDAARFRRSAAQGRAMGFAAKLCIHPDQVQPCNEAFTPAREEVERARAIVRAFEAAEAAGSASIQLDGQFIDYPVAEKARRVLALAGAAAR